MLLLHEKRPGQAIAQQKLLGKKTNKRKKEEMNCLQSYVLCCFEFQKRKVTLLWSPRPQPPPCGTMVLERGNNDSIHMERVMVMLQGKTKASKTSF